MNQNQSFMIWLLLFFHLLLFHFPSFSSSSSSSNFLCHHDESSALLQFKSSFTNYSYFNIYYSYSCGEPLLKTATWKNGTNCCSWDGVTCDTISGHVIGLNLGCEGIGCILEPNSTLFHLAHLQKLDLSYNYFSNSDFHHSKFGGFLSLTHLDLSWCYFQGEVPLQISHLSKLESLHLSGNDGLVWKETTLKKLVQNATNLRELFLDDTNMSSIRPNNFIDLLINQSSSLVTLNLQFTGLSGKLKKSFLCNLPNIRELVMSQNENLEGQLPELSCNTSLRILDLSACQFHGLIPLSFSNFTHLTSLVLSENYLNGSIPSSLLTLPRLTYLFLNVNDLKGSIPNVFPQSNRFQVLDLRGNNIGGRLPTSFSNLQQLTHLSLSDNLFSGKIPDVFGGMTKLEELVLHSNKFEGQIPSSLFTLTQLVRLDCSYNKLEGSLSNKLTGFQNLTELKLQMNLLNGTIPSFLLSLPSLLSLELSNNQFTGHISPVLSKSLEELYLQGNRLQGNIPETIFNLENLTDLHLSSNNLTGLVDFHHFSKLQNLEYLSLAHNSQLSLKFDSNVNYNFSQLYILVLSSLNLTEFPKLSGDFSNLGSLDLSNNKLSGRTPNWLLETMDSLVFLNLSQNLFTSINQFSSKSDLFGGLDLSFNLLDGGLPVSICNMRNLQFLNLARNKLSGIIPQCLTNLSSLKFLDVQMNRLYGSLPTNFSKDSNLQSLNLNGNQLEGHLPKSLSRCKGLEYLNLGSNKIEDYFPNWLQTMQNMRVLVLRDNKLHGSIANLTMRHPFRILTIFDISGNNFSGPLPKDYLKKFEAMKNATGGNADGRLSYMLIDALPYSNSDYYDSVTVTMKGNDMKMVKILTTFVSIDFSRNNFEGEIPNIIGELHALIGLNLSHNRLTGHIPRCMGNLTNLESLDLSSNMLAGMIPPELTNLNSLEVLDLSNNHLVGEIPQGKQFNTFSNDSYEGNMGLCGSPLSKICGPEQHSPPSTNKFWSEEKFGFGWKPVAIGYGSGFVFGICIGYFVFLIGMPRWIVMLFGGQPRRRVNRRRTRVRRTNGSNMNQIVQMS